MNTFKLHKRKFLNFYNLTKIITKRTLPLLFATALLSGCGFKTAPFNPTAKNEKSLKQDLALNS